MKDKMDEYAALRWLQMAGAQAGELAGSVDTALSLKAQIPELEKKRAALAAEVAAAKDASATALAAARQAQTEVEQGLRDLRMQAETEKHAFDEERSTRTAAARTAQAEMVAAHGDLRRKLTEQREGIKAEIEALVKQRDALKASIAESIAVAQRA